MTGKTIATYYIQNNFTQPRLNVFSCTAKGIDGNETKTTNFTIDGLRIQDYDVLLNNISRRVISYNIKNNFNTLNSTHINMYDDGSDFFTDQSTDMTSQENILAFAEVNYSSDSAKGLNINVYSLPVAGDYYYDRFLYRGVQIRNYNRISTNYTTYVMLFDIYNNWYSGYVNWSIGEPNIVNSTYLNSNESLMIFIENNYSTQGYEQPEINATVSSYVERIKEFFEIRPIKILNLLTLTENLSNSVSELDLINNLNSPQNISWLYNSGVQNITSNQNIALNSSETIFVYIASNYTYSDIYQSNAYVNSSSYNDTKYGVIVT
jgi:hypothetical protein